MYAFAPAGDAETDNGVARSDAMRAMMHAMGYQGGGGGGDAGSAGARVYRERTARFTEKDRTCGRAPPPTAGVVRVVRTLSGR